MIFQYRIIRREFEYEKQKHYSYGFHEVYYKEGTKEIVHWSAKPVKPFGENIIELEDDVEQMRSALRQPILEEAKDEEGRDILRILGDVDGNYKIM